MLDGGTGGVKFPGGGVGGFKMVGWRSRVREGQGVRSEDFVVEEWEE